MDTPAHDIKLCAMRTVDIMENVAYSPKRVMRADRSSSRLVSTRPLGSPAIPSAILLDIVTESEPAAPTMKNPFFQLTSLSRRKLYKPIRFPPKGS